MKNEVEKWVDQNKQNLSDWNQIIWNFAEPSWREYKSSSWYIKTLREYGFEVEENSGDMPTAFCATWKNGDGPIIGGYAEYDGVPDNCQAADVVEKPREGLNKYASGHTDPHSALGIGSLGGFLSAKSVMDKYNIKGTLKFFGEPAEKLRGSKPIHAAKGYYNDLDAAISFHPHWSLPKCNTTTWDTHCAAGFMVMYTFHGKDPNDWLANLSGGIEEFSMGSHASSRCPGATDAVITMYTLSKMYKEHMLSFNMGWSMNETILNSGQAVSDNLPAKMGQIYFSVRAPEMEMAEKVLEVLDQNAESAAKAAHCTWEKSWITKSRPGLANHVMANLGYKNLKEVGAPKFEGKAINYAQRIQKNLGLEPLEKPYMKEISELINPKEAEQKVRAALPPWQRYFTSDDYTEYCWHAPTLRLFVGRPMLDSPTPEYKYPSWVNNALGGIRECIDPTIFCSSKVIGRTVIDLLTDHELLNEAKKEFEERTKGGVGGEDWIAPLCDYDPPIHFKWPEYVTTNRGKDSWVIPNREN